MIPETKSPSITAFAKIAKQEKTLVTFQLSPVAFVVQRNPGLNHPSRSKNPPWPAFINQFERVNGLACACSPKTEVTEPVRRLST
jgi:hypothetical protein